MLNPTRVATNSPASAEETFRRNTQYAWGVAAMLTLANMCSYVDRQIINLLVDPIKADLMLTDTRMSLLQGAAFVVSYLVFTPILGRRADTSIRKNVAAAAILTWSVSSALGGFATSVTMLFISRAGVGAAEAALAPAAFSLISDYFSRDKLARALGIYQLGPYLGGGFALILGGIVVGSSGDLAASIPWLAGFKPWQMTFLLIGLAGVPLGIATAFLREPPRQVIANAVIDERHFSYWETLKYIWRRRDFYLRLFGSYAFTVVVFYSFPAWIPTILIRGGYGVDVRTVGVTYGSIVLVMGIIGVITGPQLEALLRKRGRQSAVIDCIGLAAAGLVPVCALLSVVEGYKATLILSAVAVFLYSMPQPLASTALQVATPNRMRGVASAIFVIVVSGIGLGVAPTVVAFVSDSLLDHNLRVALSIVCALSSLTALGLCRGTVGPFARAVREEEEASAQS